MDGELRTKRAKNVYLRGYAPATLAPGGQIVRALGHAKLVGYSPDMPRLSRMRRFLHVQSNTSNEWNIGEVVMGEGKKCNANKKLSKEKLYGLASMTGGRESFHLIDTFRAEWARDSVLSFETPAFPAVN